MAWHYQPKKFFRNAPNRLLKQYFTQHSLLADLDFDLPTETRTTLIYEAWLNLSDDVRKQMEQDFQAIGELANEAGIKVILDEGRLHNEDLMEKFEILELKGFYERVFWIFLERSNYWAGVLCFHHANTIPPSYWRKRKNLPQKTDIADQASLSQFEQSLSNYFHRQQGRGKNCRIEYYKRNNLDYFFAYPEDYAQINIEWENKEFKRRSHHPAFEVIFIYSSSDGTLDIYLSSDRQAVSDLQAIFANVILKTELGLDEEDERIYNLNPLHSRDFRFTLKIGSGIEKVAIRKIRLNFYGKNDRIILEANSDHNEYAIYDLMDQLLKNIPTSKFSITQVGIKVTFTHDPLYKKTKTHTFKVTYPNSCALKHEGRDLIIRKMLIDSGIEPTQPTDKDNPTV